MAALRERHPSSIGDVAVERVDDLLDGVDDLPSGDVLRLWLVDGSRVIMRPSGTEPKLKLYLDVRGDSADDAKARIARARATARALCWTSSAEPLGPDASRPHRMTTVKRRMR